MNRRMLLAGVMVCMGPQGVANAQPSPEIDQLIGLANIFAKVVKLAAEGALLWDRLRLLEFMKQFDAPLLEMQRHKSAVRRVLNATICGPSSSSRLADTQQTASRMMHSLRRLESLTKELAEAIKPGNAVRVEVLSLHKDLGTLLNAKGVWIGDVERYCALNPTQQQAFIKEIDASISAAEACLQSLNRLHAELS
jgi:hypothetical protein